MPLNIAVTVVLALLCVIFYKSKVICIVSFLYMWTLWGFNLWNGDYVSYMEDYYNTDSATTEVGYKILCSFFSNIMPFQGFMIVISAIILISFCTWGIRYTYYPGLFAFIYFPMFILEFVYIRNYICLIIIFYAIFRLIYGEGNTRDSVFLILLASSIHIFSICYLPVIILLKSHINLRSFIIVVIIGSAVAVLLSPMILQNSTYLSDKASFYGNEGGIAMTMTMPFHVLLVYIAYYIYKHSRMQEHSKKRSLNYFNNFNILSLLLIPIYLYLPYAASRSLRFLLILNLFFFMNLLYNSTTKTKIYSKLGIIFICLTIAYFFFTQTFDFVIKPLYHCNILWGYDASYQLISY